MKITIFGGSSPLADSEEYHFAYQLGTALAECGYEILTGGYMGTMEGASKGAAEAGGHVIGVTCVEIENWRQRKPNPWVCEEWRQTTLQERLNLLIEGCDAAIALPGGPGTLAEIVLMWNRMQIETIPFKPLILVGIGWKTIFHTMFAVQEKYLKAETKEVLLFAESINEILTMLDHTLLNCD